MRSANESVKQEAYAVFESDDATKYTDFQKVQKHLEHLTYEVAGGQQSRIYSVVIQRFLHANVSLIYVDASANSLSALWRCAGRSECSVDEPIVVTVYASLCPDLTLIDLPGIPDIQSKGSDQPEGAESLTAQMALRSAATFSGKHAIFHSSIGVMLVTEDMLFRCRGWMASLGV